jgi:hypothetical protein
MQTKNISFVLFCLIVAGIVLVSNTKAQTGINLGDGSCSAEESNLNYCIEAWEYVIEAIPCDNGNWPCLVEGSNLMAFKYRATAPAGCTSPTWSYTISQWEICDEASAVDYIIDTDPDGSALTLPNEKVSKCPEIVNDDSHELWKLNPTLSCSSEKQTLDFTIYAAAEVGLSCGNPTWVRTRDGCDGALLRGPGCSNIPVIETTRSFNNGAVVVQYDICTGQPVDVTFSSGPTDVGKAWVCAGNNPFESENTDGCTGRVNAGPDSSGCVIEGSQYFLNGYTAYTRGR